MPIADDLWSSCRQVVAALNEEHNWQLSEEQQAAYVAATVACLPESWTEIILTHIVENYQQDHAMVTALQDPLHPDHETEWAQWRSKLVPILRHAGLETHEHASIDLEDLVQIALDELMNAIHSFRFRSRFSTWAYRVVVRRGQRYLRDLKAAKRSVEQLTLDHPAAVGAAMSASLSPETLAASKEFTEMIDAVLTEAGGPRLAHIFRLWAKEDLRLTDIGRQVGLSSSWVSILLQQALEILRQHPDIRAWNDNTNTLSDDD